MSGTLTAPDGDPHAGEAPESRRVTPSVGLDSSSSLEAAAPIDEVSHEDFLFHLYRGSELLHDDRAQEAKGELERALRLQPHDLKGQDLLAVVYFKLGQLDRAIAIYAQLHRKNPRDTAILLNLSLCHLKAGQPSLARRYLEALVGVNPSHPRAWGYLGLACERLGDLGHAQRAFERGGHEQMARRIAGSRASIGIAEQPREQRIAPPEPVPGDETAAFEELDAGELSFELAEPPQARDPSARGEQQAWSPLDLLARRDATLGLPTEFGAVALDTREQGDAPLGVPPPSVAAPVGVAPAIAAPALVAPAVAAPALVAPPVATPETRPHLGVEPHHAPPVPLQELTQSSLLTFGDEDAVVMHPSGVALVRTTATTGFATRLEAIRVSAHTHAMQVLERHSKGASTGEVFGGVASPLARVEGDGQLMLGARHGRKLTSFSLEDEMCFVREDVLLGFEDALAYENLRLATGDGELVGVVQLRGAGSVLLETWGEPLTVLVTSARGARVRGDVVLAWLGRVVARALPASEAPCGQRGLVSFAGEGRVLVAST